LRLHLFRGKPNTDTQRAVDLAAALSQTFNDEGRMSTFSVGEVAIYWERGTILHQTEVTVASELKWSIWMGPNTNGLVSGWCWEINSPMASRETGVVAPFGTLRKRPGKQDWITLCKLDSVPSGKALEPA
jgi:hypothetical protein